MAWKFRSAEIDKDMDEAIWRLGILMYRDKIRQIEIKLRGEKINISILGEASQDIEKTIGNEG